MIPEDNANSLNISIFGVGNKGDPSPVFNMDSYKSEFSDKD